MLLDLRGWWQLKVWHSLWFIWWIFLNEFGNASYANQIHPHNDALAWKMRRGFSFFYGIYFLTAKYMRYKNKMSFFKAMKMWINGWWKNPMEHNKSLIFLTGNQIKIYFLLLSYRTFLPLSFHWLILQQEGCQRAGI